MILLVSSFAVWQSFVANRERVSGNARCTSARYGAKSLLNETSNNLNNLPDGFGNSPTNYRKSAKILDSLSADVDDAEFLSELGIAYQQLAGRGLGIFVITKKPCKIYKKLENYTKSR